MERATTTAGRTGDGPTPSEEPTGGPDGQPPAADREGPIPDATEDPASWRDRLLDLAETTDGTATDDGLVGIDRLRSFGSAILVMRWGTILASVALTIDRYRTNDDVAVVLWCAGLLGYTAFRTFRPLRYMGTVRSLLSVLAEVALNAVAVVATGYWESPFIFSVMTAVVVAGFARGFGFAVRIAIVIALAVSLPFINTSNDAETIRLSAQWSLVLLLVALIAGYARRISGEADRQHSLALDRLGRLADANALLYSLHRVAQTLPASLDIDEVLDTTVGRLRGLFDFDFAAVLVLDETDGQWALLRREGARLPLRLATLDLPPPLTRALTEEREVRVADLSSEGGPGLALKSSSGIYAPLPARGSIIGLVAVEDQQREHFTERDGELLRGFVEPVGLAIDNARWFGRLRTVGADEERTRIARDLHDRIGQSLAYLAFELDRIVSTESRGEDIGESLERLRDDVRGVIREVRDTLYDLRTDVSDGDDLASVLDGFAFRIQERSGIEIKLICDRDHRLPILQEREMWRIAQEALTNIERHSGATKARIVWRCNGESAVLDITDNGAGFPIGRAGRLDSYGILGMRERASSIGATLDLTSREGEGTRVRCILLRQSEPEERPVAAASGA